MNDRTPSGFALIRLISSANFKLQISLHPIDIDGVKPSRALHVNSSRNRLERGGVRGFAKKTNNKNPRLL